ncbi:MAG: hypothetical protein AAGH99_03965 [Planctomycetota bacterium]
MARPKNKNPKDSWPTAIGLLAGTVLFCMASMILIVIYIVSKM